MEKITLPLISVLLVNVVCLPSVISQQPVSHGVNHHAAPSHQNSQNMPENVISVPLDTSNAPVTNHYPYQSSALSPSAYHQSYPGTYGNRDGNGPLFGLTAGAGWELSAYIAPFVWYCIIIFAMFGLFVGLSRVFLGTEIFGGMLQRAKDVTGRSLDMDNLTNMVYQAIDAFDKYSAKDALENLKG